MQRALLLVLVVAVVLAGVGASIYVVDRIDEPFSDPPEQFLTVREGPVTLKVPPTWKPARSKGRGSWTTVYADPATKGERAGRLAMLRFFAERGKRTDRRIQREHRQLLAGKRPTGISTYELDVEGAGRKIVGDLTFEPRPDVHRRVSSLELPHRNGKLVIDVRGPETSDPSTDPRVIIGSVRYDP